MRFEDWRSRMSAVFSDRLEKPFDWASNDCGLFAADCILAATGVDPAEKLRGRYSGARSAYSMMRDVGWLAELAEQACGAEVDPKLSVFGDIGLIDNSGRPCLAVCGGEYFHAPGEDGLKIFPLDNCLRAWRLPD